MRFPEVDRYRFKSVLLNGKYEALNKKLIMSVVEPLSRLEV